MDRCELFLGGRRMLDSKTERAPKAHLTLDGETDDVIDRYKSNLQTKYGLSMTDPLPDDVIDLIERLKTLRNSGGQRVT